MLGNARIAVVVPAFNEALLIAATLRTLPSFVDHVLVIDDGSVDATAEIACSIGDPRVQVVRHPSNRGVGAALKTGYTLALQADADVMAVMAADGQMHPDDLSELLWPVVRGEVDYTKGDRLSHPSARTHMPLARFIGNHVLSLFTRLCTGRTLCDSQCGYTALSRRALERLPIDALWDGYGYPNDLLGRLCLSGASVRDVVVRPIYGAERSGIGLRHALCIIPYVLLRVLWRRLGACRAKRSRRSWAAFRKSSGAKSSKYHEVFLRFRTKIFLETRLQALGPVLPDRLLENERGLSARAAIATEND